MFIEGLKVKKTFAKLLKSFGIEATQEASQQFFEEMITNLFGIRQESTADILANVSYSALIGGLVGSVSLAHSGVEKFSQNQQEKKALEIVNKAVKLEQADMVANNLKAVGEVAKQVKTVMRNPQKAEEFVERTVGKDTTAYISSNALNEVLNQENEIKQQVLDQLGISKKENDIDNSVNANVRVPLAKWMVVAQNAKMSNGKTLFDTLINYTKLDEDGYTIKEAQEQKEQIKMIQTELEKDIEKQKQVLANVDKDTKYKLNTFFNMILDEAQPETMSDKNWNSDKQRLINLWTAQALVNTQKRNIDFNDWYEQNKNLRFVNELSESRKNIKKSAKQALQDIFNYILDTQKQQEEYELQKELIDNKNELEYVISNGGIRLDKNDPLYGDLLMLSQKESGIKGIITKNYKASTLSQMAEMYSEDNNGSSYNESEFISKLQEQVRNYKNKKVKKVKQIDFFSMPTEQFVAEYEKLSNMKLNLDKKSKIQFHKDFVREAIKQGASIDEKVLKDLGINPDYVDKRVFEDINSEDVFNQAMTRGIDKNKKIPIVNLTEAKIKNKKELKKYINKLVANKKSIKTRDNAIINFVKKVEREGNKAIDTPTHIIWSSRRNQNHNIRYQAIDNIENLIKNSFLVDVDLNSKKDKKDYDLIYRFYVPVRINEKDVYTIRLTALHNKKNNDSIEIQADLYDVIIDKKNQVSLNRQLNDDKGATPDTISIEQLLLGVNGLNEKVYFQPGASYLRYARGESLNSLKAKADGKYPKSLFVKEYGIKPKTKKFLEQNYKPTEWHHTGKFANETYFWNFQEIVKQLNRKNKINELLNLQPNLKELVVDTMIRQQLEEIKRWKRSI